MLSIEFRNISVSFPTKSGDRLLVVQDFDLVVEAGTFVALVGPSGCGKSTLLNALANLVQFDGTITVDGVPTDPGNRQLGYMFQESSLFPWRTAKRNALLGLEIRGQASPDAKKRVSQLMDTVGLGAFEDAYPSQLSGGMKKRLSLVQTLAYDPPLLLMDEPFGALDFQTRMQVERDFLRLVEKEEKTVLFVTHDIDEAIELADRIIVMTGHPGTIKADYRVPLERPRTLVEKRGTDEFVALRSQIWEDLRHDFID